MSITYRKDLDRVLTSEEVDSNFLALDNKFVVSNVAPVSTDDVSKGFEVDCLWLDLSTSTLYKCISNDLDDSDWSNLVFSIDNGLGSLALGVDNDLNDCSNSLIVGRGLRSPNNDSICFGTYNLSISSLQFCIGAGFDSNDRCNMLEIHEGGVIVLPLLSIMSIDNPRTVTTKEYVDGTKDTTLNRPTANVKTGHYHFDTDLNKPIWFNSTDWTDSAGLVV